MISQEVTYKKGSFLEINFALKLSILILTECLAKNNTIRRRGKGKIKREKGKGNRERKSKSKKKKIKSAF